MRLSRLSCSSILTVLFLMFLFGSSVSAQTETFDAITFTPPKGWVKSAKDGVVIYTNQADPRFAILTVYAASPGSGSPQTDFASEWNELIVKPFNAQPNPHTETKTEGGWTAVAGGAQVDSDGVKAAVIMTVYSGYGKTVATYVVFNDESYIAQIDAFNNSITLDKSVALKAVAAPAGADNDYTSFDPFPDQPYFQPQKPLTGRLKKSVTMADLVGKWEYGDASVESYYSSSSGNYVGSSASFFAETYTISPNGTFEKSFSGRSGNHTVREKDSGTVKISGNFVIMDYHGRITFKYQVVTYMLDPSGGVILTVIPIGANDPALDLNRLRANCGHSKGYVYCVNGEEWIRRPAK